MSLNLSALSQYQTRRFFEKDASVTQQQCNEMAQQILCQSVSPTACQGGTSYTVEGGKFVVQFRAPNSPLDMALLQSIEQAYQGFVPRHEYRGQLGQLHIYLMNNVGGKCMYMARTELQVNNHGLLRFTIDDYARFFTSTYSNPPRGVALAKQDSTRLFEEYSSQLQQLREGLPQRFHSTLDNLIPQLPDLFAEDWPLVTVPNHTDLFENNIHVDTTTGKLVGVCDWGSAEISPLGMSLGWLEIMLGTSITTEDCWRYHPNHQELRDQFWATFYNCLGGASDEQKRRIEVARLTGLFLANGFQNGHPATEDSEDLRFLGAVVLN